MEIILEVKILYFVVGLMVSYSGNYMYFESENLIFCGQVNC